MQLSLSYQLANPLSIEFGEVLLGALVGGVGKDEYSTLGVVVVGRMLPYANAAAVAKAMAMTVSIQIKQVSINDFTHGSLLVVILVISFVYDGIPLPRSRLFYYLIPS